MGRFDLSSRSVVFRSVVLVGVAALLVGVAGIFYFRARDEHLGVEHPRDACAVVVHGLASVEGIALQVAWAEPSGGRAVDRGLPGREPGQWLFRKAPEGAPLTLRIERRAGGRVELLHEQPAFLTRGGSFEVWMPEER